MKDLEIIQTIVDKIELNLSIEDAHELSVHQLAEFCDLSPWHFQRLFKSLVGDTLGNYLRGRRLSQAAHLLANSDQNILDIAMAVGFNSHEALTRSFKTKFGLSPSQYRLKKPEVELNKKPVLTTELYQHFSQYMQQEPIISRRPRTELIGFQTRIPSPFMVDGSFCDLLEQSWYQLFQHQSLIRDREAGNFYGLTISPSGNFDEAEVDYIAAIALTAGSEIPTQLPEGMIHYSLPEQQIATFDVAQVNPETVGKTMDYIYGYWLPKSGYERAQGDDYEYFENIDSMESEIPRSQYILPIT